MSQVVPVEPEAVQLSISFLGHSHRAQDRPITPSPVLMCQVLTTLAPEVAGYLEVRRGARPPGLGSSFQKWNAAAACFEAANYLKKCREKSPRFSCAKLPIPLNNFDKARLAKGQKDRRTPFPEQVLAKTAGHPRKSISM